MAKRKETVTVRAWAVLHGNGRPMGVHWEEDMAEIVLRHTIPYDPRTKIVPCTITYTKPGGKKP